MANKEFTKAVDPNREQAPNVQFPPLPGSPGATLNRLNTMDIGEMDNLSPKGPDGEPLDLTAASTSVYAAPYSGNEQHKPPGTKNNFARWGDGLFPENSDYLEGARLAKAGMQHSSNPDRFETPLGIEGSPALIPGAIDPTDTSANMNALALEGNPDIDQTGSMGPMGTNFGPGARNQTA